MSLLYFPDGLIKESTFLQIRENQHHGVNKCDHHNELVGPNTKTTQLQESIPVGCVPPALHQMSLAGRWGRGWGSVK